MFNFIINTGLQFWKASNRKIFAVSQANLDLLDKGTSDSKVDKELAPSAIKKLKRDTMKSTKEELATIQSTMSRSTPDSIMQQLNGLIRCCICHVFPLKPPLVISKCCKSIM